MAKRGPMTEEHKAKMAAARAVSGPRERKGRDAVTHTVKSNRNTDVVIPGYTRGLAIKLFCTACMGFETNPSSCASPNCALFPFRKKTRRAYESDPDKETFLDEDLAEETEEEEGAEEEEEEDE